MPRLPDPRGNGHRKRSREPFMKAAHAFYLVAYTVTILAAFGIVTVLSSSGHDAEDLEDYRGLFWRRPAIAGAFTVAPPWALWASSMCWPREQTRVPGR